MGLNLGMKKIDYVYKNFDPEAFSKNIKGLKISRTAESIYFLTYIVLNSIRDIDQIHLIDSKGNLILSSSNSEYVSIEKRALEMVLNDDRPLKIINAYENRSAAIIKLSGYTDTYLYVVKFLDQDISRYLTTSEEAINFYYTVENQNLGIKISFALIYIVIVALLLFLAITIAIKFSSRFFISINNLITASEQIGKGNLEAKVPELKADKEMEILNA